MKDSGLGYPANIPSEVRGTFFHELSKYSAGELADYFIDGTTSVHLTRTENRVVLPKDSDDRKELIHDYLLGLPERFGSEFRLHLDYDVMYDKEAEEIIFSN
jgi:hypothetical protein